MKIELLEDFANKKKGEMLDLEYNLATRLVRRKVAKIFKEEKLPKQKTPEQKKDK